MNLRLAAALALALAAHGCTKNGTYVVLTINAGPATPTSVVKIDLEMALPGRTGMSSLSESGGAPIQFPTTATLNITSGSGTISITAIARNAAGQEVDRGSAQGTVVSGTTVNIPLTLGRNMVLGDMAMPGDLGPNPDLFGASPVTLTVQKSGGAASFGTVIGNGLNCGTSCAIMLAAGTQVSLTQSVMARKGAWFQQWSGGGCSGNGSCTFTITSDTTVTAEFDLVNYVFTLGTPVSPALGALASDVQTAADNTCKMAAASASLPGSKWAAYISTSSSSGSGAKDAGSKLLNARGWIRPDGLPFADSPMSLNNFNGQVFYPARLNENGYDVGANTFVATGSLGGLYSGPNCSDWSSTSTSTSGGEAAAGSGGFGNSYHYVACSTAARFYCFGLDYQTTVTPPKTAGHVAFLSSAFTMSASTSRDAADAQCQADAAANPTKVPAGTYQALLATTSEAASKRFSPPVYTSTVPWVRPDGVIVVNQPADLFNFAPPGTNDNLMLSAIDVTASGQYGGRGSVWTGATDANTVGTTASTCNNWVSTGGTSGVSAFSYLARVTSPSYFAYPPSPTNCTIGYPVYCLQVQ
jgi:hypothetical protein